MEPFEVLDRARAEFARRLAAVTPEQWPLPTPCEGWTVRDLVRHVVAGDRMSRVVLAGGSREEAIEALDGDVLGDDPRAAFEQNAAEQATAFRAPGAFEVTCHHPGGDIPGETLFGFRIADYALHAWDLARAIGADEELDGELVVVIWAAMEPMAPFIPELGYFASGPSGNVDEGAPVQQRLLDLSGRRP